jgi:hypothetical protein
MTQLPAIRRGNVVALHAADKFNDAQARPLGGSQPRQLLADPATPKFAATVDGDASPSAIDFDVDEADALVAQEAYPSVPIWRDSRTVRPSGLDALRWGELSPRRHKKRAVWPVLEPGRSRGRGRYLSWAMAVRFGETMRRVAPATEDTVAGRVAFT